MRFMDTKYSNNINDSKRVSKMKTTKTANEQGNVGQETREKFQDFANETTLHGIKRAVVDSQTISRRIFWILILILMTSWMLYELVQIVTYYLQ